MKTVYINGKETRVTSLAARRLLYYGHATEVKEEKKELETKEEKKGRSSKSKK